MIIILDSNIWIQDSWRLSPKFEILFSFAKKTKASIVIPEIVFLEIKSNYIKKLREAREGLRKAQRNAEKVFHGKQFEVLKEEEVYASVETFIKKLTSKVNDSNGIFSADLITSKNPDSHFQEVIGRIIARKRPATETKENFKDCLIWLCVLEAECISQRAKFESKKSREQKKVAFISSNTRDFADSNDIKRLHPELLAESRERGISVLYYVDLEHFLRDFAAEKIEFINENWILENIDFSDIEYEIDDAMMSSISEIEKLVSSTNANLPDGILQLTCNGTNYSDDFYVHEISDECIIIMIAFDSDYTVELEVRDGSIKYCSSIHVRGWFSCEVIEREVQNIRLEDYSWTIH